MVHMHCMVALTILLLAAVAFEANAQETGLQPTEQCADLGFNSGTLQCSDCQILGDSTGDEKLSEECGKCCQTKVEEIFELAVLELDSRYTSRLPGLAKIVKSAEALDVVIRNRVGVRPTLYMYKERTDELPEVELNIFSWTLDVFQEYISAHTERKSI